MRVHLECHDRRKQRADPSGACGESNRGRVLARLIRRRRLSAVNDEDFSRAALRVERKAEVFL
jgi:hypothetical protein